MVDLLARVGSGRYPPSRIMPGGFNLDRVVGAETLHLADTIVDKTLGEGGSETTFSPFALDLIYPFTAMGANYAWRRAYTGLTWTRKIAARGGAWPYVYSLSNPPSGMTVDAVTGVVTWVNPTSTATDVEFIVTDSESTVVSATISITVGTSGFRFVDSTAGGGGSGTIGSPWNTLEQAFESGLTTDHLYLRGSGPYNFTGITTFSADGGSIGVDLNNGPSVWMAYPGDAPVIDHDASNADGTLIWTYVDELFMQGISFTQSTHKFFHVLTNTGQFDNCSFSTIDMTNVSNASMIMTPHNGGSLGFVVQRCTFTAGESIVAIRCYDTDRILVEDNTLDGVSNFFDPKDNATNWTVRNNKLYNVPEGDFGGAMITSNMNNESDSALGEVCFNLCNSIEDSGFGGQGVWLWLGPNWLAAVGQIWFYRNTFRGRIQFSKSVDNTWLPSFSNGPFYFWNNVIVNETTTGPSPHTKFIGGSILGYPDPDWDRIELDANVEGVAATGIIDSDGNLQGSYATASLGVAGYQRADGVNW